MPGHVLHRHTAANMPTAASGDGCYLIDTNGKRYLDACGGAAVSALGHSNPVVLSAVRNQIDTLAYAHTGFYTSEPAEALAD
ncbi:MAG: aminotransferase class III-fold pyridoxal phosphate-dependent enzyme, partial [Pseudomonadota bacterium]